MAQAETQRKIHGNSLLSRKPSELYHLINQTTGVIEKIGITSAPSAPAGRYSQRYLEAQNVRYTRVATFENRLAARAAETEQLREFYDEHGTLPRLNKRFY